MITIEEIGEGRKADINIPNEPFRLFGTLRVAYSQGRWTHEAVRFPEADVREMVFPDENYDYAAMAGNHIFLGAYDGGRCVGLAILRRAMFRYLYLYDLKVNAAWRRKGVGARLVERAAALAAAQGWRGLYTQAQDTNLGACLFYLRCGFEIGGLDTRIYDGTSQEGVSDILFYRAGASA